MPYQTYTGSGWEIKPRVHHANCMAMGHFVMIASFVISSKLNWCMNYFGCQRDSARN